MQLPLRRVKVGAGKMDYKNASCSCQRPEFSSQHHVWWFTATSNSNFKQSETLIAAPLTPAHTHTHTPAHNMHTHTQLEIKINHTK